MCEQVQKCLTSTSPHINPDSRIWEILACRIQNPGTFCSWYPESRALGSRTELKYSEIPLRHGIQTPRSTEKKLESSTRNPQSTEWDPESKTVLYSLTWGDSTGLRTASYYNADIKAIRPSQLAQQDCPR